MKKVIFGIFILILSLVVVPLLQSYANAPGTLDAYRRQLRDLEAQYAASRNQQAMTQNEIAAAQRNIRNSQLEIDRNRGEIDRARIEIENLNLEIARTEEVIRELLRHQQIANSGNAALEFVFEAESYADLIYRFALNQQISSFQADLIEEFNENILRNEELQAQLAARERELDRLIIQLDNSISALSVRLVSIEKGQLDIRADIASRRNTIREFEALGCRGNETMSDCVIRMGHENSPRFFRPMNSGVITSPFGWRNNPLGAGTAFHAGIDIGGNPEGTPIFSVANGTVSRIVNRASCGGNIVYVWHTVNGRLYTSEYMHLLAINVRVGQRVTSNTVVGTVGGGRQTPWDRCSTGAHLHFGLSTGWRNDFSSFRANIVDPRSRINLPGLGGRFSGAR